MSIVLMSAVVSAQGNAPGVRPDPAMPSKQVPAALSKVSFEQRLNEQLPLDLAFKDESGRTVKLGEYFGRKPVVLTFVYYECPMLCTQVLNGLESSLRVINESVGTGIRRRHRELRSEGDAGAGGGQEEGVSRTLQAAERRAGLALPDRRPGVDRGADARRRASTTRGTRRHTSSRTPAASW